MTLRLRSTPTPPLPALDSSCISFIRSRPRALVRRGVGESGLAIDESEDLVHLPQDAAWMSMPSPRRWQHQHDLDRTLGLGASKESLALAHRSRSFDIAPNVESAVRTKIEELKSPPIPTSSLSRDPVLWWGAFVPKGGRASFAWVVALVPPGGRSTTASVVASRPLLKPGPRSRCADGGMWSTRSSAWQAGHSS
jgi:hypothetical protein